MKILNLGCGSKISLNPDVTNIDWNIYLRIKSNPVLKRLSFLFTDKKRRETLNKYSDNIMVLNLAKNMPFETNSIDAVYHSHMLEHLDRETAKLFLVEVKRILKPNGVHRIAVPDLEKLCRAYLQNLDNIGKKEASEKNHEEYIASMLEQCVRKEAFGSSQKPPLRRFVENLLLGDARKRGETHNWMYDKVNLSVLLSEAGYKSIEVQEFNTSLIPKWNEYGLDQKEDGSPYKSSSLYVEAVK